MSFFHGKCGITFQRESETLKSKGSTKAKKAIDTLANEPIAAQPVEEGIKKQAKKNRDNFVEDKYFSRQIDKWESLKDGSYVTVGNIMKDSPLNMVGMPDEKLFFDVSKIKKRI